ncbi:alpha/beta hydrolase [Hydrogenophaga sp. 5NK40-0174]|uniref:alpha/beta fold hydrolase n=1 Tax=Hydrogenophaga sp. 5NK40-0174 TaxID=3127649 RepID=UPI0033406152
MANNNSSSKDTYVLVHGAWHTGETLEPTARIIREQGHDVHCPTLAGNRPGDDYAKLSLQDAIDDLVAYLEKNDLKDVRLMGHSYGGMLISGAAERVPERIRRLVYVNAFVPNPGECLADMTPPNFRELFDAMNKANNGAVVLPYPIWREAFINDADGELAQKAYDVLHPQPYRCFVDPLPLKAPLAALEIGKSYVNCVEDTAMPHSLPWHPRLSERLGLFRYVACAGSHESLFTQPEALAKAIIAAGRD